MNRRAPAPILLGLVLLLPLGCRNPHAQSDVRHREFATAAKRYQDDCPANVTAGNDAKTKQCKEEHEHLIRQFQAMQAADR